MDSVLTIPWAASFPQPIALTPTNRLHDHAMSIRAALILLSIPQVPLILPQFLLIPAKWEIPQRMEIPQVLAISPLILLSILQPTSSCATMLTPTPR